FAEIDPSHCQDDELRHQIAAFLHEAGRDDAARAWLQQDRHSRAANVIPLFETGERGSAPDHRSEIRFEDVGGLEDVKTQIKRKIIAPFEKPELFQVFKRRSGGGVLMYGPPGCGKTLLARATAGEARAHFIAVAITDVLNMYIGQSEKRLAALFAEAK